MRRLHLICAWILAVTVLLAGPLASLAECLRCPPDCPMHAPRVEREHGDDAPGGAHAHHEHGGVQDAAPRSAPVDLHAGHGAHGAAADASGHGGPMGGGAAKSKKKCHEADGAPPAPKPGDGPCISGTCGHMDVSLARVLPEGVLARPGALAPELLRCASPPVSTACPPLLPLEPPTEPPRAILS